MFNENSHLTRVLMGRRRRLEGCDLGKTPLKLLALGLALGRETRRTIQSTLLLKSPSQDV